MDAMMKEPALNLVSYHAVTRYVQRILGVSVSNPAFPSSPRMVAAAHCAAAGRSMEAVRRDIMTPALQAAVMSGLTLLRTNRFRAVIDPRTGVILTILKPHRRSVKKLPTLSKKEHRRSAQSQSRKEKRRPSAAIRAAREARS